MLRREAIQLSDAFTTVSDRCFLPLAVARSPIAVLPFLC
jgi:hypothetical protein